MILDIAHSLGTHDVEIVGDSVQHSPRLLAYLPSAGLFQGVTHHDVQCNAQCVHGPTEFMFFIVPPAPLGEYYFQFVSERIHVLVLDDLEDVDRHSEIARGGSKQSLQKD